ncbi:MAG: ABC transporter ATP-binding protein [Paenibacillaceae bacterium]|nr:ABC transporter ATP-binding protein [Paenibacillaceae bacterium]
MTLLAVQGLSKRYGTVEAVRGLTFAIGDGRCVSLLGPNGAGKTSTLRMLAGLLAPTTGTIRFAGEPVTDIRPYIGYLPQMPAFHNWMTGLEFLAYVGKLAGMNKRDVSGRSRELLEQVGLAQAGARRIGGYSGGMKQRLGIAQAMIHRPKLLLLDEPVSALDPLGRREVLDMLRRLKGETTMLFSTHVLHDAEDVCDDVLIMRQGEIAVRGSLDELRERYRRSVVTVHADEPLARWAEAVKRELPLVTAAEASGMSAEIEVGDLAQGSKALLADLAKRGIGVRKFEAGYSTLEELFLKAVAP